MVDHNKKTQSKDVERKIKILVAATNMSSLNNILHLISDHQDLDVVATALDGEECLQQIDGKDIDVVVVELALSKISGVKVAEYLSLEKPGISTVILADQSNLGFYRSAMLAGAREFLITPIPGDEFAFSIRRVYEIEAERQRKHRSSGKREKMTLTGQVRNKNGKIIVMSGGKGGTGRSFISANLASMFANNNSDMEIAIADFDLQFGDISAIFSTPANKSIVDLVPVVDELSLVTMKSVATKISDNLELYASPPQLERSELITSNHATRFLDSFRDNYDLTIINTGALMTEISIDLMEKSDYFALVVNPEVLSVKACSQIKSLYDKLGYAKNQIGCILNKENKSTVLTSQRVAETLHTEVIGSIPFLPGEVAELLNEGKLVQTDGSPILKSSFNELMKKLNEKVNLKTPAPA